MKKNLKPLTHQYKTYYDKFRTFASDSAASVHASRLLNIAKIEDYLDELSWRIENRIGTSIDRVLGKEAMLAFYNPAELIDPGTREFNQRKQGGSSAPPSPAKSPGKEIIIRVPDCAFRHGSPCYSTFLNGYCLN